MPQFDNISNAYVSISHEHYVGHAGRRFFCTQIDTVADGGSLRMIVQVPSGSAAHFNFEADSEAIARIMIFKVGSFSNASSLQGYNRNTFSTNTPQVLTWAGGSLEVTSLTWGQHLIGAGQGANATGDIFDAAHEFILKPGTYAFDVKNVAGQVKQLSLAGYWYEL